MTAKHLTNVLDERAGQSCTFNGTSQTCWTSVLAMEPHKHLTNVLDERAGRACWPWNLTNTSQTCWTSVLNRAVCLSWSNAPYTRTKGARVCATGCDAENRVESRAVCFSWSNAPCTRTKGARVCSSGTYGIGMVQCSVPKVLEYARRAVTVRRAENRVQCSSNVVGLQCGQWCRSAVSACRSAVTAGPTISGRACWWSWTWR